MSSLRRLILLVVLGWLTTSCGGSSATSAANEEAPPTSAPPPDASEEADVAVAGSSEDGPVGNGLVNDDSSIIFDQDQFHTFELELSPEALARLDADPTAEIYEPGTLTFRGETIDVGIRYKGSVGGFVGCTSEFSFGGARGGGIEVGGEKTCTKLSIKVKINWQDAELGTDQQFYGLKKLQFHAMNLDASMMRERLGYHLFRSMGVPAPRATHARVLVNGIDTGVYALVEQIDGRFTRENFDDGTGNLYKEVWPLDAEGQVRSDDAYLAGLRTNEDDDPSVDLMRSFAEDMAAADPAAYGATIESWMSPEEFIAYSAVDRTIRNDDGAFHWYCFGPFCEPHNFYWYEDPTAGSMHLIPWDVDNAFGGTEADSVVRVTDRFGEISNDCNPIPGGLAPQRSAACDPIFAAFATFADDYDAAVAAFVDGPFSEAETDALLNTWSAQIETAVADADATHADAPSVAEWERELAIFKRQLDDLRAAAGR